MKLNNKGFAVSSIMYLILIMTITIMLLVLAISSSRKLILDKQKKEATNLIFNTVSMSYRQSLEELKRATQDYIKQEVDFNDPVDSVAVKYLKEHNYTVLDDKTLEYHNLTNKYITFVKSETDYKYYISKSKTYEGTNIELDDNIIDIVDYKIYGNSYQEVVSKGKNILDKSKSLFDGIRNETAISKWADVAFNNEWVLNNLKPNTTYTMSFDAECVDVPEHNENTSGNIGFYLYSGVSGFSGAWMNQNIYYMSEGEKKHFSKTFITPSTLYDTSANYRILVYTNAYKRNTGSGIYGSVIFSNIQLEEGSSETSYEQYIEAKPIPTNPSEIKSLGNLVTSETDPNYGKYKTNIELKSKNLFNISNLSSGIVFNDNGITVEYDASSQVFTINGTTERAMKIAIVRNAALNIGPKENIVMTSEIIGGNIDKNGEYVYYSMFNQNDTEYFRNDNDDHLTSIGKITKIGQMISGTTFNYYIEAGAAGQVFNNVKLRVQIEHGTKPTDWAPYVRDNYNIYLNNPLRCVNEYCDYIDGGRNKVITNIKEKVIDNLQNHKYITVYKELDNVIRYGYHINVFKLPKGIENGPMMSNYLKNCLIGLNCKNNYFSKEEIIFWHTSTDANLYMSFNKSLLGISADDTNTTKIEKMLNYVNSLGTSGKPLKFYYVLKDKVEEEIGISDINLDLNDKYITINSNIEPTKVEIITAEQLFEIKS